MPTIRHFHCACLILTMVTSLSNAQVYPLLTIEEVQFVLDPEVNDVSFFVGDTIEVRGQVMNHVGDLALDGQWGCFIVDPTYPSDPWQGLTIIQEDTSVTGTLFGTVQTGMICRFTGVVREVETCTQVALLTDPLIPVIIESTGSLMPSPILLGTNDLTNRESGEQWESQLVRIDEATVTDTTSSNRAIIEDMSGLPTFMDDYFSLFHEMFENGTYQWPSAGITFNITGLVRGLEDGFSVNPRTLDDLALLSPVISDVLHTPAVPTPEEDVTVSAIITDETSVTGATLYYSIDWEPWSPVTMDQVGDLWSAEIPLQQDGSFLRYFVSAIDNDGQESIFPADTSQATGTILRYVVRFGGPLIEDVQNNHGYGSDEAAYLGRTITLSGVVMSGPEHFAGYYIQDAGAGWSGIFVSSVSTIYEIGDWIQATGVVVEDFGLTKLSATSTELIIEDFGAFDAVPSQTGDLATDGPLAEEFESVLVSFDDVTVTDAYPDLPNNFGEFIIDDGSGGLRVDDESELYEGNLTETIENGMFGFIRGIHFYSFGDFKLAPRDSTDVSLIVLSVDDPSGLPSQFELMQNYPNPFNPTTAIGYSLPRSTYVTIEVFNLLGERVSVLENSMQDAGNHTVTLAADLLPSGVYLYRMRAGEFVKIRRMMLLK